MSIEWHVYKGGASSADGRFEIDEVAGGWQAADYQRDMVGESPLLGSFDEAVSWCEMRVLAPADVIDDCQPHFVVIEGVDGVREVIRRTDAPSF